MNEFNVSIRNKNSNEEEHKRINLKNVPFSIKITLIKSQLKKDLIDYFPIEKSQSYVNVINDIEIFIEKLNLDDFIEEPSEIKINALSKIINDSIYFICRKHSQIKDISGLKKYINDKLLLLI